MGFAVGVDQARGGPLDEEARALPAHDTRAGQGAGEEAREKRQGVEGADRWHDREVDAAIVHARAGGNAGGVAVLVDIGDREGEGGGGDGAAVDRDLIGGALMRTEGGRAGREVAEKPPLGEAVETRGDLRLEAEAGDGEKRVAVGEAGVDQAGPAGAQNIEGAEDRTVDAEMAAKTIAGAAREEAERGGCAGEDARDLVHCAVTADGDDEFATLGERLRGEFAGMGGPLGDDDGGAMGGGKGPHGVDRPEGRAGAGIHDETGLHPGSEAGGLAGGERKRFAGAMKRVLHVLTGCTAAGKTEWALRWAESHGAEIVSCDSLLFYRGMDIGTAKPTVAERARVPHHLIDVCGVTERMDITHYVVQARRAVEDIAGRGRAVLVAGGSGFYLKAFFAPVADDLAVVPELRAEVTALSLEEALGRLRTLNPAGLGALDVANPRRVTRALERCLASGRTLAELVEAFARQPPAFADWEVRLTQIERAPEDLARRIDRRVDAMLGAGLEDEVRALVAAGLQTNPSAALAIGYREVIDVMEGRQPREKLAEEIARNTRGLVKKQRTWFRTQLPEHKVVRAEALEAGAELFAG